MDIHLLSKSLQSYSTIFLEIHKQNYFRVTGGLILAFFTHDIVSAFLIDRYLSFISLVV